MNFQDFAQKIADLDYDKLEKESINCRGEILTMTTISASGHPGGSMSTLDSLLTVYSVANISKSNLKDPLRDRIVVSHGHISPAVYSILGTKNILPKDEYIAYFRKAGSVYEGHIERAVPGIEWTTGNLGQGLSAACGMAVAGKVQGQEFDVFVFMGDGEHQKGQIQEARRFATKFNLSNITVIIDYNQLQISGSIDEVMPSMKIAESYMADGWEVLEIDGHNFHDIAGALLKAKSVNKPVLILARTVMGKGVSFMEDEKSYHGSTLNDELYFKAMKELGLESKIDKYRAMRKAFVGNIPTVPAYIPAIKIDKGSRKIYAADVNTDNRSAFGSAISDLVKLNHNNGHTEIAIFDCDLASSVKTNSVEKDVPSNFFQCGIAEHHTAVCAGAASVNGVVSFFADFGMFGVDEVYNQQRLNQINDSNIKVVTTHVGVDVGEDGKTHMCIDYIGLLRNALGFQMIVPADPNEVDVVIRYVASTQGNFHVAMGRSKVPVITKEDGSIFFDENYEFEYGKVDEVRSGTDGAILAYGATLYRAIDVHNILKEKGLNLAVINVPSPAYLNDKSIDLIKKYSKLYIYEDHISATGLYSTVANIALAKKLTFDVEAFGVNQFPMSGNSEEVYDMLGLSSKKVANKILENK